jgi:hypothetical protein
MRREEDYKTGGHAYDGVCKDFGAFARRGSGTRAVRAERNPVCCFKLVSKLLLRRTVAAVQCCDIQLYAACRVFCRRFSGTPV